MGDFAKEFGRRIRARREALGYTQQELATRLHKERSTVAGWEAGRRMPDIETREKLEALLGDLSERSVGMPASSEYGRRQLRGLLRAQGATPHDIRVIFDLLDMRAEARRREEKNLGPEER